MHLFFFIFPFFLFLSFSAANAEAAKAEMIQQPEDKEAEKPLEKRDSAEPDSGSKESFVLTPDSKWKEEEPIFYRMPSASTKGVQGKIIPYVIWYDHALWKETEQPLNQYAEKSFRLNKGYAYGIIVTDKNEFQLEDLDDIVIKNAKVSGFAEVKIVSGEKRNVNGKDVLFMHWQALFQGIDVDFLSYIYSGPEGSIFIHTYTPTFFYKKNLRVMEYFLNGFTLPVENVETEKGEFNDN